jgi:hypothetical protein
MMKKQERNDEEQDDEKNVKTRKDGKRNDEG